MSAAPCSTIRASATWTACRRPRSNPASPASRWGRRCCNGIGPETRIIPLGYPPDTGTTRADVGQFPDRVARRGRPDLGAAPAWSSAAASIQSNIDRSAARSVVAPRCWAPTRVTTASRP